MQLYIHNHSRFIGPPLEDLTAYKQEISQYTELQFRRANRFVLLSLAGACRCADGQVLKPDTAVYLTTENGNLGDVETVLDQIYHKRQLPMPYNFISTLSNTASFYIAQSIDTQGRNLTFSSKQLSFERGLELLASDMAAGAADTALVGGVDEACFSKSQFEARFKQSCSDYRLIEGSCWLLLKAERNGALGGVRALESFHSLSQVKTWLNNLDGSRPAFLAYGILLEQREKETIRQCLPQAALFDYIGEHGYFDSVTACGVSAFLERAESACLVHINKDFRGQFVVLVMDKY